MTQGLGGGTGNEVSSAESVVGDVCVYGISEGRLMIINNWSSSKYPISKYPPIGVVVVPGSHGHYADGKCAVMSLNYMNCDTPTTGGDGDTICWGVETNINTLPNLNQVPYVGSDGNVSDDIIGQRDYAILPCDTDIHTIVNPYDTKTKYDSSGYYIPSPYNNDETFNPNYSMTSSPSSTGNCLADFDGKGNTQKILTTRGAKDYQSWKPTWDNLADYPAASCCDMYSTYGTNQGEWYLPSAGEFGYVVVRQQAINDTISKLISAGVTNAYILLNNQGDDYWSSSEYSGTTPRGFRLLFGTVLDNYEKSSTNYVRAFCLV